MLGFGLGIQFYRELMYVPFYTGLKSSYNIQGSGGTRLINYIPFGFNKVTNQHNKWFFGLDIGPAHIMNITPYGKVQEDVYEDYPQHKIQSLVT